MKKLIFVLVLLFASIYNTFSQEVLLYEVTNTSSSGTANITFTTSKKAKIKRIQRYYKEFYDANSLPYQSVTMISLMRKKSGGSTLCSDSKTFNKSDAVNTWRDLITGCNSEVLPGVEYELITYTNDSQFSARFGQYAIRVYGELTVPEVTTTDAANIAATSVNLGGNVTDQGADAVTERGIVYSTTDNTPEIGETNVIKDSNGNGTGSFSDTISSLAENTTYYFRSYAINSKGTGYGEVKTFTTLLAPPKLISITRKNPSTENTTATSVIFTATFTKNVTNVSSDDFILTTTSSGSITNVTQIDQKNYDITISNINSTAGNVQLGIKGVGTSTGSNDIEGVSEGQSLSSDAPVTNQSYTILVTQISTNNATNITANEARLGGSIQNNGVIISERGVLYSVSDTTPEIGESNVTKETNSSGTGNFSETIISLIPNTLYYFRTYAITNANTKAYGEIKSFTTEPAIVLNNNTTNKSLSLTNIDDYLAINNISNVASSPVSIAMWVNPTEYGALLGEFDNGSSDTRNFLSINNDGKLTFDHYDPSGGTYTSNGTIPKNQWTHIAFTQENGSRKFYINGVLDTENSNTEEYSGTTPNLFYLGYRGGSSSGNNYSGQFDEVTLWSKVLSNDEISNMYNFHFIDIADNNLQQYFSFDNLTDATNVIAVVGSNASIQNPANPFTATFSSLNKHTVTTYANKENNDIISDALVTVNSAGTPSFSINNTDGLPITINSEGKLQLTSDFSSQHIGNHNITFTATINGNDYKYNVSVSVLNNLPTLTTADATNTTFSTATLGGEISLKGLNDVTERGVVYSVSDTTPEIGETNVTKEINGSGIGSFSEIIGGFESNTTYYYRSFATSSQGTAYGAVKSFTTVQLEIVLNNNTTNKSLSLTNIDDYLAINNISNVASSPVSIAMWINPTEYGALLGEFDSGSSDTRNFLSINNDGKLTFDHYDPSGGTYTSNGTIPKNQWTHIAFTQENGSRKFYINGVLDTENSNTEEYSGTTPNLFYLGYRGGSSSGNNYSGQFDEVTLWSKVLSNDEISNMYNFHFIDIADNNLQQYFSFDNLTDATNVIAVVGSNASIQNPANPFTATFSNLNKHTVTTYANKENNDVISDALVTVNSAGTPSFSINNTDGLPITINSEGKLQLTNDLSSQHIGNHNITFTATINSNDYKYNVEVIILATPNLPVITTSNATNITVNSATLGGEIINTGTSDVIERGIVYSITDTNLKIGDADVTKDTNGTGIGVFSENITDLTANTIYYYRAYATNNQGTSYGDVKSFSLNNALHFDGNNDRVTIADNANFDFSNGFTAEAWIKPNSFSGNPTIFSQFNGSNQRTFAVLIKGSGVLEYSITTSGITEKYYETDGSQTLDLNQWNHVAFTYDGFVMRAFVNGEAAGEKVISSSSSKQAIFNSIAPIEIGARDNNLFFGGAMDEVRIWNRALTETEINNQKEVSLPSNTNGLIAYYKFDQGIAEGNNTTITTLTDYSTNNLTGTLHGFAKTGATSNFVDGVNGNFSNAILPSNTFTVTGNWSTPGNWSLGIVPTQVDKVTINSGKTVTIDVDDLKIDDFTLENTAVLNIPKDKEITIQNSFNSSGSLVLLSDKSNSGVLFVEGTSTGTVTYKRGGLLANKWSIVTPPVTGQKIKAFAENVANNIRKRTDVTPNKYAISYYDDSQPSGQKWVYYFADMDENLEFEAGKSYAISRATDGDVSFTGTLITETTIKTGVSNQWNAVGNPFTTYFPANKNGNHSFLNDNLSALDDTYQSIYVWDNAQNKYVVVSEVDDSNRSLTPGQGFFVRLKNGQTDITFNEEKRSTKPASGNALFNKTNNATPSIHIKLSDGNHTVNTAIKYFDNATTGFDKGYDIGNFNSDGLDVFTRLVDGNIKTNFTIQSLPKNNYENMVIPIGINAKANSEITFSVTKENIPDTYHVFLEDNVLKTFHQLDKENTSYKITVSEDTTTAERFSLHITSKALSVDDLHLNNLNVFLSDTRTLKITGLNNEKATVKVISILGKELLNKTTHNAILQIPDNLKTGVYIVKITSNKGNLTKKIILE